MTVQKVRIRMLGNAFEFLAGEEYEVDIERANALTGMGYAVLIDAPAIEEEHNA